METAKRQFRAALSVDLALPPRSVCAVAGDFHDETTCKIGIDSSDDSAPIPIGLLQCGSIDSCLAQQTKEPAFQSALASSVYQSVE